MIKKDYCTLSPEGNWANCCKRHDRRYKNKRLNRYQADKLFYRCVVRKSECRIIGGIYFIGVRTFGWYFYKKAQKKV